MALCVRQNRLHAIGRQFELFGDFGGAHAIVEVIDNGIDRHTRFAQHRSAAMTDSAISLAWMNLLSVIEKPDISSPNPARLHHACKSVSVRVMPQSFGYRLVEPLAHRIVIHRHMPCTQ